MALWTKKKLTRIFPAKLEKVPLFVLLILQFNIYITDTEVYILMITLDKIRCCCGCDTSRDDNVDVNALQTNEMV